MKTPVHEVFSRALNLWLRGKGHGAQASLAKTTGLSPSQINDILHLRRKGDEDQRREIAAAAGYTYEDFLALACESRLVREDPRESTGLPEVIELLRKAKAVLASPHDDIKAALGSNIETFFKAVQDRETIHRLQLSVEAQDARLGALEEKMSEDPPGQKHGTDQAI